MANLATLIADIKREYKMSQIHRGLTREAVHRLYHSRSWTGCGYSSFEKFATEVLHLNPLLALKNVEATEMLQKLRAEIPEFREVTIPERILDSLLEVWRESGSIQTVAKIYQQSCESTPCGRPAQATIRAAAIDMGVAVQA